MKNGREFDNVLDDCIERVTRGEDIKACLARYPQYAAELEPLLKTALDTKLAADIKPRPEFRQRAAYEFQAAIRNMPAKESRGFRWQLRWVVPVAVVLVVLGAGSGTVFAASSSLPGEPLYKVKLATETVQIAFTPSDMGKAELYAKFADRRVEEIVKLADKGEAKQIEQTTDRMNSQLIAMANITGNNANASAETASGMLQAPAASTYESADTRAEKGPVALQAPAPAPTPAPAPEPTTVTTPPAPVTVTQEPASTGIVTGTAPPVTVTIPEENVTPTQATPPAMKAMVPQEQTPALAGHEDTYYYGSANETWSDENNAQLDRQEKLKRILSRKVLEHLDKLQKELEDAPDDLKPALERAIEVLINGYETNLSNLK